MKKVALIFGTRPEAIKMAPVYHALKLKNSMDVRVCVTAQHREMLDQVLELFDIEADFDLNLMKPGQDLFDITTGALLGLRDVFNEWKPDIALVHGDTSTTLAATLTCFYLKIPVAHVEAGLRSGNMMSPWPEEMNRRVTGCMTALHLTPTESSRQNLLRESISSESVHITGNTVIDALNMAVKQLRRPERSTQYESQFSYLNSDKKLILITGHRRENFGRGFEEICTAIAELARRTDVEIIYPVHLNPNVREPVQRILKGLSNVHLIEPLDYLPFVYLLDRCYFVLTDSGGIQEEAPSLGKPVLVLRDTTERPEAVTAGTAKLVGTQYEKIVASCSELLDDRAAYHQMARAMNPYGDGKAAIYIADIVEEFLSNF